MRLNVDYITFCNPVDNFFFCVCSLVTSVGEQNKKVLLLLTSLSFNAILTTEHMRFVMIFFDKYKYKYKKENW